MLALVAGAGRLPVAVAAAQDAHPLVCTLAGHVPDGLSPDISFRIEQFGSFLKRLSAHGVTDVCLCGGIQRPQIEPTEIDGETKPLMPILDAAVAEGEDKALRAILGIFELTGFVVRGAHELAPGLLPAKGVPTQTPKPDKLDPEIDVALNVLREQARLDFGQSCVIREGTVVAREDSRGTDAMLRDLAGAHPNVNFCSANPKPLKFGTDAPAMALDLVADRKSEPLEERLTHRQGGFLFKASKPGQDLRVDMPTIGPETAERAAEAGLDGIVIEAGRVLVLDQDQLVSLLNVMGMYLWVR